MTDKPCVVVGCGNALAGDDAAGVELVDRLRRRGYTACEMATAASGFDLIETLRHASSVLVVDAVSSEARAGTLHVVSFPSPVIQGRHAGALSLHAFGAAEAIELAHALGLTAPVMLLGIEIASVRAGAPLSPQVASAIDYCVENFDEIRRNAFERFSQAKTVVASL